MTTVHIEDSTPEGRWLLDLIKDHKSVTIGRPVAARPFQRSQERDDRAEKTGGQAY